MSVPGLPASFRFVTQLLNSLPSLPHAPNNTAEESNPLRDLPEKAKKQLISLQVLFPNEFVPALDLLDRRLITRFRIRDGQELNVPVAGAQGDTHHEEMQVQNEMAARTSDEQMRDLHVEPKTTSIPKPQSH